MGMRWLRLRLGTLTYEDWLLFCFTAVVLSVLTIRKGLLGIAAFLCTVLPHGLVYLLVWYVLSGWSGQIQKKLHILPGLLLLIITGAGAFLEVFVSPFLWGLFP